MLVGGRKGDAEHGDRDLLDQLYRESGAEARQKRTGECHGDQVDCPWLVAATHYLNVGALLFVLICVKAHGRPSVYGVAPAWTG